MGAEQAERLTREKYVSLTTYRRDGRPVATPVWVVGDGGRLYVWTGGQSGKAKRLRNREDVTVAPCDRRGRVTGEAVPGTGRVLPASETERVSAMLLAKYGVTAQLARLANRIGRLVGRSQGEQIGLELAV